MALLHHLNDKIRILSFTLWMIMIKKYLSLSLLSFSLCAMQSTDMVVYIGEKRPLIPFKEILQFRVLAERLVQKGHRQTTDGTWIYGEHWRSLSRYEPYLNETKALWVLDNMRQRGQCCSDYDLQY